mmetsp:Transcript_18614/g.70688  ORF Transcript_18614/g.70688 Transcript_18614/m.70688 type:complete len:201 (-) Transcript_18614:244-846(-)
MLLVAQAPQAQPRWPGAAAAAQVRVAGALCLDPGPRAGPRCTLLPPAALHPRRCPARLTLRRRHGRGRAKHCRRPPRPNACPSRGDDWPSATPHPGRAARSGPHDHEIGPRRRLCRPAAAGLERARRRAAPRGLHGAWQSQPPGRGFGLPIRVSGSSSCHCCGRCRDAGGCFGNGSACARARWPGPASLFDGVCRCVRRR